jgi:hypothetical protein
MEVFEIGDQLVDRRVRESHSRLREMTTHVISEID